jgi:hypothetical protein
MKKIIFTFTVLMVLSAIQSSSFAQLQVNGNLTPDEMVQYFVGAGINYSNVQYTGADTARGIFTNGATTNLGVDHGLALTSGTIQYIAGPNYQTGTGFFNGTDGDSLLSVLAGILTYDACILEFDFIPAADTAWCDFVFGSEEYPEFAGSVFNDIFGFFVSGPDPAGGNYEMHNIALVPGTNLPVAINSINHFTNTQYYIDNEYGATIEYDGFTTVLKAKCPVVPGSTYHFRLAVADAGDGIFDTGVMLEAESFESQGPADFLSFSFLSALNPGLEEDVIGEINDNAVYLTVPNGTDLSGLVASFETPGGVIVAIESQVQQSSVTPNDFTQPVNYTLDGVNIKNWTVKADFLSHVPNRYFEKVSIGPNPSAGKFEVVNVEDVEVSIYDVTGIRVIGSVAGDHGHSLTFEGLSPGIYFLKLKKDGVSETRKMVVR